jgi:heterodisulfide reductase subunit B
MSLCYAFFPGCVISAKYLYFERASREVARALGIELVDLPFSCCPPTSNMKLAHYDSWLALAVRNLSIAEGEGLNILTLCTGCASTLKEADYIMKQKPNRCRKVNQILKGSGARQYEGTIQIKHLLDVLHDDVGLDAIESRCVYNLHMKVASHYGCHFFRPSYIMYPQLLSPARSYVPTGIDEITQVIGGTPVKYMRRFLCCGYPLGANVDEEGSYEILREKLHYIRESEADLIAVICASCFEQFELGQVMIKKKYAETYGLPTLYISQLIGLALGIEPGVLGINEHIHKMKKLLPRMEERPQKRKTNIVSV